MQHLTSKNIKSINVFFIAVATLLSGCASIEQRCQEDMANSRFNSFQECMAFRYQQQRDQAAANRQMNADIQAGFHTYDRSPSSYSAPASGCSGYAPYAPIGCHMSCINGGWSSVCP
jgi:uncharacterized protein YceK